MTLPQCLQMDSSFYKMKIDCGKKFYGHDNSLGFDLL